MVLVYLIGLTSAFPLEPKLRRKFHRQSFGTNLKNDIFTTKWSMPRMSPPVVSPPRPQGCQSKLASLLLSSTLSGMLPLQVPSGTYDASLSPKRNPHRCLFHPQPPLLTSCAHLLSVWLRLRICLCVPASSPPRASFEQGGGKGGRGFWTQNLVYQKWPDQIFPIVNFVFSHYGHFGLGRGGGGFGGGVPPPSWFLIILKKPCLPPPDTCPSGSACASGHRCVCAGGGGVGIRPRYLIVCLWRRLLASRHCSF